MSDLKIKSCTIGPYPKSMMDMQMPEVKVVFEDDSEKTLFEFYPDELHFSTHEFIGLTEDQARELRRQKDIKYLQS